MSNSIINWPTHRAHFPVAIVSVGEQNNLFDKIQHCFFAASLNIRVGIIAVFTLFSSSPAQMQTCIEQLAAFKETLDNCDAEDRAQREQVQRAYAALPEYIKQKFVSLSAHALTCFVQSQNQPDNENSIQKFISECGCVIGVQKTLLPVRNFFSRASDRVDPNQEVDPNPRLALSKAEKRKRNNDPLIGQLTHEHRKRGNQIIAMCTILDLLANKNIDVRTKKLKEEGECSLRFKTMRVPVYPFNAAYNGPLHRFDLEWYLYKGRSGPLVGDAFIAAIASKKGFECFQCQKSEGGCVLAGQEPGTILKVDTAFQKMLVKELVHCFSKISDAQIRLVLSELLFAELSNKGRKFPENEIRQKFEDFIKHFPSSGSVKQRMQNILGSLYDKE